MNLKYRVKKKWCGFWQKYRLKSQAKNVRKLFIFLFFVWLLGSVLTIISQWYFAADAHKSVVDYVQYLWIVIIELVSGFDIPDTIKLHTVSRLISIFMLVMGIVVVGLFTGQIISMFVHVLQRAEYFPEKPENFKFKQPILICGNSAKLHNIIRNLRKSPFSRNREIVIIDPAADQIKNIDREAFYDTWYVVGDPGNRYILENAIGKQDCRVIILSGDISQNQYCDSCAINAALAIEAFDEDVHTVIEIARQENIAHYATTRINDWISISEYSLKLISQSALQPGIANVYSHLLGDDIQDNDSTQIYFSPVPLAEYFIGKSYHEIKTIFFEQLADLDITLIGFVKYLKDEFKKEHNLTLRNSNHFIQINPIKRPDDSENHADFFHKSGKIFFFKDTKLTANDMLVYLSQNQINFNKILKDK